jgi:hypothetical protein
MTAVCVCDGCGRPSRARGRCQKHYDAWRHTDRFTYAPGHGVTGLLVCDCPTPAPTPSDMCSTCCRVIAELVHARRLR